MNIRIATVGDIEQITPHLREFYAETPYSMEFAFHEESVEGLVANLIKETSRDCIVAEYEDKIVGVIGLCAVPMFFNLNIHVASELFLWVGEKYRKAGVAKLLIDEAEQWAVHVGCHFCDLALLKGSPRIESFYKAQGYTELESHYFKRVP